MSIRNTHRIRVLWTDCDPAGITFYGNYYRWMDDAAYYLFKSVGIRWEEWRSRFDALGIPLDTHYEDASGRPVSIVDAEKPIYELF